MSTYRSVTVTRFGELADLAGRRTTGKIIVRI